MTTKRASQSLFAIPGAGKRQPNFATAMQTADINFLFPDTAKTFYKLDQTREDVLDCSGQELYQRLLLGEIGDISVSFDATPKIIALLAAYGFGVAASPSTTAAIAATAQLTTTGVGTIGQTLIVGGKTYTISADGLGANEISVGSSAADFASKIATRVTTDTATTLCTAAAVGAVVTFTRNTAGTAGNGAPFSTTDTLITINHGFTGGAAAFYTHAVTELPLDVYQGPAFSAVFGFRGGSDPLLLRGCNLNSFSLAGKARQKITGQANIKFAEATVLTGFSFPACVNEAALRFQDSSLTVDAVDQAALLRSWDFSYDLKLLTDDHAYTNAGIHCTRLERADRRERKINYAILGDNSDAAYAAAEAGDQAPVILGLGTSPNKVTFSAANTQLELDGGGLAKDGQVGETNIKIAGMPMINGTALPMTASIIDAQSTAFLVSST